MSVPLSIKFVLPLAMITLVACEHTGTAQNGKRFETPGYATLSPDGRFWEVDCPGLNVNIAVDSRADFYTADGRQMNLVEFCEKAEDRSLRRVN